MRRELILIASLQLGLSVICAAQDNLSDEALHKEIFKNILGRSFPKQEAIWFGPRPTAKQVAVCWESLSTSTEQDRKIIRDAAKIWEDNSRLTFVGWQQCAANNRGIRIVLEDVAPTKGPHTKGLGNELDGKHNGMSLDVTFQQWSPTCAKADLRNLCIRTIAIHEFGHALGFAHEQNRDDTPDWCTEPAQGSSGTIIVTPWDPDSIMNYCNNIYTKDAKLSRLDIYTLQLYYGKP